MVSGKKGSSEGFDAFKQKVLDCIIKKYKSGIETVKSSEISEMLNKSTNYIRPFLRALEESCLIERVEKTKPDWRLTKDYIEKLGEQQK
jgi:predicted transcriptional regulator